MKDFVKMFKSKFVKALPGICHFFARNPLSKSTSSLIGLHKRIYLGKIVDSIARFSNKPNYQGSKIHQIVQAYSTNYHFACSKKQSETETLTFCSGIQC